MVRIPRWTLVAAMAMVLLVAVESSVQAATVLTNVQHPNVLVTIDPQATSQNEVTIAAFPNNPDVFVATARDTRQTNGFSWVGYYLSTDGGKTWTNSLVPGFPEDTSPEGRASPMHSNWTIGSDPVITADREGRVYLARLAFGPTTTQFAGWVVLTRYSDFGATYDFTSVAYAGHDTSSAKLGGPGNSRVTDKEWIAVDDTSGPCDGNLYMPWALFESAGGAVPIVFQRSTDGGRSWTPIIHLSHPPNTQNQGTTVAVGPNGEVYVAWEDFRKDTILFTRSLDCGASFEPERPIASIVPVPASLPGSRYRLDSFPRMAVSQTTGTVFVTWADYTTGNADVVLVRSTNHGMKGSLPSRVNDVAKNNQIFPAITTFGGRVDVAFYDSRNDPQAKLLDVYYAQSNDDGAGFLPNVRVTDAAFDPNLGITAGGAAFLGDYNGIASNAAGVHPIWADNRNVSPNVPRDQDIYTATVS